MKKKFSSFLVLVLTFALMSVTLSASSYESESDTVQDIVHTYTIDTDGLSESEIQLEIDRVREAFIAEHASENIVGARDADGRASRNLTCSILGHNPNRLVQSKSEVNHWTEAGTGRHLACYRMVLWELYCTRCPEWFGGQWSMDQNWTCDRK